MHDIRCPLISFILCRRTDCGKVVRSIIRQPLHDFVCPLISFFLSMRFDRRDIIEYGITKLCLIDCVWIKSRFAWCGTGWLLFYHKQCVIHKITNYCFGCCNVHGSDFFSVTVTVFVSVRNIASAYFVVRRKVLSLILSILCKMWI